jgi:hypothetical protein
MSLFFSCLPFFILPESRKKAACLIQSKAAYLLNQSINQLRQNSHNTAVILHPTICRTTINEGIVCRGVFSV